MIIHTYVGSFMPLYRCFRPSNNSQLQVKLTHGSNVVCRTKHSHISDTAQLQKSRKVNLQSQTTKVKDVLGAKSCLAVLPD